MSVLITHCNLSLPPPKTPPTTRLSPPPPFLFSLSPLSLSVSNFPAHPPPPHQPHHPLPQLALCPPPARLGKDERERQTLRLREIKRILLCNSSSHGAGPLSAAERRHLRARTHTHTHMHPHCKGRQLFLDHDSLIPCQRLLDRCQRRAESVQDVLVFSTQGFCALCLCLSVIR